ncbi:MAG TPA: trypsin-like peptidase domain-containing protein [Candidatus Limnocylindrales bacterium]|nr:trypsin-like peptidase domain-containing protein [Candidatus Limnocylindrales bacterium]
MRPRKLALLFAPFLLLAMLPGAVSAAGPSQQAQSRAEVLAYWTPERMKSAKWRDVAFDPGASAGRIVSNAAPTGTSTGASWPSSATDPITRATGRAYFTMGTSNYICSGSVVTEGRSGYSVVLTAAHCTVDETNGRFATNWLFIPAFDLAPTYTCGNTWYGCWTAKALVTRREFATAGALTSTALQHDWAFAVVAGGGKTSNANLDLVTQVGGSFALEATSGVGTFMTAIGYPAAQKYRGKDLVYCQGTVGTDSNTSGKTYRMACDMTGGSSGGPWVRDAASGYGAKLKSLNSYGYSGVKNMYGPIFNTKTQDTLNTANSTTTGTVLVGN